MNYLAILGILACAPIGAGLVALAVEVIGWLTQKDMAGY